MNDRKAASEGDPDLRLGSVAGMLVGVDMQTTLALHCGGVLLDAQGRRNVTASCATGRAGRVRYSRSQTRGPRDSPPVSVRTEGPPAIGKLAPQ